MARKKGQPQCICDLIDKTSRKTGIKERLSLYRLERNWTDIIGDPVASHSHPHKMYGRTLYINVEHPTWLQELSFLKKEILKKIQSNVTNPKITDIRFVVGNVPDKKKTDLADGFELKELDEDEIEFIEMAAKQIEDPETQEIARNLMKKSFGTKRKKK